MTQKYIRSVDELPEGAGTPDQNWQTSGIITGYIDIVGFKQMIRDNGIFYINATPEQATIIAFDAYGTPSGRVDRTDKTISYISEGQNVTAILTVNLYWHKNVYCLDEVGMFICGIDNKVDTATFQDTESIPNQFNINMQEVVLKKYNGTVYKPYVLSFNVSLGITSYQVTTTTGSLLKYIKVGEVNYTVKGIPFLDLIPYDSFNVKGHGVTKLDREMVLNSTGGLTITMYSPYGLVASNITTVEMPASDINSRVYGLLYIIGISFGTIFLFFRSL